MQFDDGPLRVIIGALFPNEAYQRDVQVGGPGPADHPAPDHKVLYDLDLLVSVLTPAGFDVVPLEWWDREGVFQRSAGRLLCVSFPLVVIVVRVAEDLTVRRCRRAAA